MPVFYWNDAFCRILYQCIYFYLNFFFGKFGSLTQGTRTEDPLGPELSWGSGPAKVGRPGTIFKFSGPGGDGATLKYQKNIGSNESYLEEKIKSNIGLRKYKFIDKIVGRNGTNSFGSKYAAQFSNPALTTFFIQYITCLEKFKIHGVTTFQSNPTKHVFQRSFIRKSIVRIYG